MPIQLKRLLLLGAILVSLFIVIRSILYPKSFGEYGHYRANSLIENANHIIKYTGDGSCVKCHDSTVVVKDSNLHALLPCEVCHGPGYMHIKSPKENKLAKPIERQDCGKCHSLNKGRPEKAVVQQDLSMHNVEFKCVKCHNPHAP